MDPREGLGCWGLIHYAGQYYGYELPHFEDWIRSTVDELNEGVERFANLFEEVDTPQPGDIVTFSIKGTGIVDHIGIMISGTRFLHSYEKGGVCQGRLNSPVYQKRLTGIFRWTQQGT